MKRFLMFLVILIAVVSLGLTIYYFSVDNEMIYIRSSYLVVNAGNTFKAEGDNGLLDFRNKSSYTTLTYTSQDEDILSYSEEGFFRAEKGGETQIIVNTNNRSYSRLVIDVLVCDGSVNYPFMVRNEEELLQMDSNKNYKLNSDIELTKNWTPKSFNGVLDGNHYTIKGLKITDAEVNGISNVGFISILGGTIKNLNLADIDINVSSAVTVGAFAGTVNGGLDADGNPKGIIQTSEATGTITNSTSGKGSRVGGIAGVINSGKIDRCGFDGTLNITGDTITAGGIIGVNNDSVISESYAREKINNGTHTGTKFGGIVGEDSGNNANIYDCYFYAKEELVDNSSTRVAGIVYKKTGDAMVTGCYYGGKMAEIGGTSLEGTNGLIYDGNLKGQTNYYLSDSLNGFRNQNKFITTKSISSQTQDRTWNFSGVWTMGQDYPILNVESSVGSDYVIDDTKIETTDRIATAQALYDAVKANDKEIVVAGDSNGILDMNGFVWEVIPIQFDQTFTSENNVVIKNFTIDASNVVDGNVGLVSSMGENAKISNVSFESIEISADGNKVFQNVGVLAGRSYGAKVNNVSIKNNIDVNISGVSSTQDTSYFGTLFGLTDATTTINKVEIQDVDVSDGYFTVAGGIVGGNRGIITADGSSRLYNYVSNVKLVANYAGGVAGTNGGSISYTTADNIQYDNEDDTNAAGSTYTQKIYTNGLNKLFVGGIVGANDHNVNGTRIKGSITDVYSNGFNLKATSKLNHKLYFGGIAGSNSSEINRAYVKNATLKVGGSHNAFVGGVTGYNSGRISNSVVDADSSISTNVGASVGTSVNSGNYILNTDNCTIVGGIAGYDTVTTNGTNSIYKCATLMKEIKGYYAGGISGISFGKVQYCYCGESTKDNGGVSITGYLAGGLTSVIAGGYMKNCYTFCRLTGQGGGNYQNVMSVVKMEVCAVGGLAVFALNAGTVMENCYCVTTLGGNGVSYGSSADLTGFVCGTVTNCAYQTAGSVATRNGTKLSQAEFKGSPNFNAFKNAIGGDIAYWDFPTSAGYPTIAGVNVNFPSSSLPVFH